MRKSSLSVFLICLLLGQLFFVGLVSAATSASFYGTGSGTSQTVTYEAQPAFQTYYTPQNIQDYWPILGNQETCESRQDLLLQIAPAGCQPAVVRSDLLEDQNVPVFCQVDAVTLNPLLDINQITGMTFTGTQYPPEVAGVGFHPARAALRTHTTLLGSPLINNIGYVTVILKRQANESSMPDFVNVSLRALLQYDSGNAFGVGRSEFLLSPMSDDDWTRDKFKNSFWGGRYFVRLDNVDVNTATISIYDGNRRISSVRAEKGKQSQEVYLPGMYCRAGFSVLFDSITTAQKKAQIEISSGDGTDMIEVYEGSQFLDGRCSVRNIILDPTGETGNVTGTCSGTTFSLQLQPRNGVVFGAFVDGKETRIPKEETDGRLSILFSQDANRKGSYELSTTNVLGAYDEKTKQLVSLVYSDDSVNASALGAKDRAWLIQLRKALALYKEKRAADPTYAVGALVDAQSSPQAMAEVQRAIATYQQIVNEFPAEREENVAGLQTFGEQALQHAIQLARDYGLDATRTSLLRTYLEKYPNSDLSASYSIELGHIESVDTSLSGTAISFNDKTRSLRLVSLSKPAQEASAHLFVDQKSVDLQQFTPYALYRGQTYFGNLTIASFDGDSIRVNANCSDTKLTGGRFQLRVNDQSATSICDVPIRLDSVNTGSVAKIQLLPTAHGGSTETNLTVRIGIEKRAVQLNPDMTADKIERLNKTIKKWEDISNKLGQFISGMKAACFATSGLLTLKNFMFGLNGGTLARQEVMNGENGWRARCEKMVADGTYKKLDECFSKNSDAIDADVSSRTGAIEKVNAKIESIQKKYSQSDGLFGESVDSNKVKLDLAQEVRTTYGDTSVRLKDGTTTNLGSLVTPDAVQRGYVTTDMLRSSMLASEVKKTSGVSGSEAQSADARLTEIGELMRQNQRIDAEMNKDASLKTQGFASAFLASPGTQQARVAEVVPVTQAFRQKTGSGLSDQATHSSTVIVPRTTLDSQSGSTTFKDGTYILGLRQADARTGEYTVTDVLYSNTGTGSYEPLPEADRGKFLDRYGVGIIKASDRVSYANEIAPQDRQVRYYENEPYKGMPAIVPFDVRKGWYAATRQTTPAFGGIGAFDSSGRVTSVWICNVGDNKRIEFESGFGDDLCQQVNTQTGQSTAFFPGLSQTEAQNIIRQGMQAVEEAARSYGSNQKFVKIQGQSVEVGRPSAGAPGTNCADFMSPKDCLLMFNVCDPVICPSSRCDLGGKYPVADVVQTGIIGSIALCLPNFREGILIPVCLTGIQAGIDGLVSIMKNYRDCLTENLKTGKLVGICDQIYSIYLCEFFWRQVAPFAQILIPSILESAYGQGTRGGAEYLTVMNSWQNMENSMKYFTQNYAANSFKTFQIQSLEEAGTEVCKVFISSKLPSAFKTLIEPESPVQFHAWFDSTKLNDATVPATSQYKVFYHIYAGKDEGAYFTVYLRNPPESSYYSVQPRVVVASGFIPQGQYASETKDFSAPEGYKELCVRINDNEQCGFKQVSTSFAVNSLRDSYVQDQLENTNIQSEKTCIAGSPSVGAVFANTNPQSAVEEAAFPETYNRGIVRICATQNPGSQSDPSRFVDVGYCDSEKIRCWLDKTSVDNAITANNLDARNQTLTVLQNRTDTLLGQNGDVLPIPEAAAEIRSLKDGLQELLLSTDKATKSQVLLDRIALIYPMILINSQKAQVLFIKGQIYEILARDYLAKDRAARQQAGGQSSSSGSSGTIVSTPTTPIPSDYSIFEGRVPSFESDGRLVIDFDQDIGSYSLNSSGGFEYRTGDQWISVEQKLTNQSISAQDRQWLAQLKRTLVLYRERTTPGGISTPQISPNSSQVTFTDSSVDYSSIVYEFQDGTANFNVFYRYKNTLGWQWSTSRDREDAWTSVQTTGSSQLNEAFMRQLQGVSYARGVQLLLARAQANAEGGWFASSAVSSNAVKMSNAGVFTVQHSSQLSVLYRYSENAWQWSRDGQQWNSLSTPLTEFADYARFSSALSRADFITGAIALFDVNRGVVPPVSSLTVLPSSPSTPQESPSSQTERVPYLLSGSGSDARRSLLLRGRPTGIYLTRTLDTGMPELRVEKSYLLDESATEDFAFGAMGIGSGFIFPNPDRLSHILKPEVLCHVRTLINRDSNSLYTDLQEAKIEVSLPIDSSDIDVVCPTAIDVR